VIPVPQEPSFEGVKGDVVERFWVVVGVEVGVWEGDHWRDLEVGFVDVVVIFDDDDSVGALDVDEDFEEELTK
jgi:hypothetical protein